MNMSSIINFSCITKQLFKILPFLIISCSSDVDTSDTASPSSKSLAVKYVELASNLLPNGESCADIYINQHLSKSLDYGMCFGNKSQTINKNFDFKMLYLLKGGSENPETNTSEYQYLAGHDTDYIVAMRLCAVENANGDFKTPNKFTGGYHGYNNETSGNFTPTMYELSKKVYADGIEIKPNSSVLADSVKIIVVNLIQGANTEKKDGSGRNIVKQTIIFTCKGGDYDIEKKLAPLENILLYQINGLCFFNDFDNIQFVGSKTHTGTYPTKEVIRADKNVSAIRQFNDNYFFEVYMDLDYGLGNSQFNDDSFIASTESANKSYFNLVSRQNGIYCKKNKILKFKGGYRFGECARQ